jgi:transcriptional regulator of arginine metabolism
VAVARNIVVVKTGPGHASTVSQALDEAGWPEWVGSIAGENTIFAVARSEKDAKKLEARLRKLL